MLTFKFDLVNQIKIKCQHQTMPELQQQAHSPGSLRGEARELKIGKISCCEDSESELCGV